MGTDARNIVLLLTHSGDHFTIDRVAESLAKRGAEPRRVDTDLYPSQVRLSSELAGTERSQSVITKDGEIDAACIRAVWIRRLWSPQPNDSLDQRFVEGCTRESTAALRGFLDGLTPLRWIDELPRMEAAQNKLRQLRLAQKHGLVIPNTLVTNDPDKARRFHADLDGAVVAKMLTALSTSMDKASFFVRTSDVLDKDIADLSSLRYSPMVFQERISKSSELRVIYVDGRLFVGSVDASDSAKGRTDWREATPDECGWRHDELDDETADGITAMMRELGLVFGAIDLIRTPDGRHVFLEVNPAGEWGMLERDLDLPISDAIAGALLQESGEAG